MKTTAVLPIPCVRKGLCRGSISDGEANIKSRGRTKVIGVGLLVALTMALRSSAQEKSTTKHQYELIDIGIRPQIILSAGLLAVSSSFSAAEARSQQMQNPENVQTPRTESSLNELSDLRRRAGEGEAKAQYDLGRIYMFALGVSQDYQQAAKWYEHAAEQGFAEAQFRMGFLYEQGKGVHRDYTRALEYYRAAADQGHATAANNLASLYLHGLGVPKNIGTALKWYQFSAEHGDAVGQCNLGTLYFDGDGVPKDYHEAARWFRAAAEQDFPPAENNLAFLYFTGQGVVQDYRETFKWMSRAAEQGYARAQINLGDLYVEGKGVSLDYVTAYMWYSLGSAGDPGAAIGIKNLSRLITSKQRIEARDRASAWLSSHRNVGASHEKAASPARLESQ